MTQDSIYLERLRYDSKYKRDKNKFKLGAYRLILTYVGDRTIKFEEYKGFGMGSEVKYFHQNEIAEKLFSSIYPSKSGFMGLHYNYNDNLNTLPKKSMNIKLIEERYLSKIDSEHNIIFIKSGQGTGKSEKIGERLINYINQGKKVLIYSNRISLSATISEKIDNLSKKIIKSENDTDICIDNYQDLDRMELSQGNNLIISPESNYKIRSEDNKLHKYDIVWLDEVKKLMNQYPTSDTLKGKRQSSLQILSFHIRMADEVLVSDADLNNDVIQWIEELRGNRKSKSLLIYNRLRTDQTDTYVYGRPNNFHNRLHMIIKKNKYVYYASTSVKKCKEMYNLFCELYPDKKIMLLIGEYAEDNKNHDLIKYHMIKECNMTWKRYDIVISSPCIIYGVSFDMMHFHEVFYEYCGTLNGEYVNQSLHRVRRIRDNRINLLIYERFILSENLKIKSINDLLNGNLNMLNEVIKDIRKRDILFHNVRYVINNKGEYRIDDKDLLYKLMIKTEVENYQSFQNIWLDIVKQICKNRAKNIFVECLWEGEEEKLGIDEIEINDRRYYFMNQTRNLEFEEYREVKHNYNRTKMEELCIVKNKLRFRYKYNEVNEELLEKLEWFDTNKNNLMCYLKNCESTINDVTDLRQGKIVRLKFEEILKLLGFNDGILSNNEIYSYNDCPKQEILFKLKEFQKLIGIKNQYRGNEFKINLIMGQIDKCGRYLGLCIVNKQQKKMKIDRIYKYQLCQDEISLEILRHLEGKKQSLDRILMEKLLIQNGVERDDQG